MKHFARDEVVNRLDGVLRSFQVEIRPLVCTCSQLSADLSDSTILEDSLFFRGER